MISSDIMRQWKVDAGFMVLEIELFDEGWRQQHKEHDCSSKNICSDGRWYCKHLTIARKKNKRILELKKAFILHSPFVQDSNLLSHMAETRYGDNNL